VLARVTDATLLVVRAGVTSRDALHQARGRLRSVNAPVIGGILNDVNLRNPHYANYYYQYQYQYHEMGTPTAAKAEE
jgi:receptor protein-tyrosine kinase